MSIWFCSDQHFSHARISEMCGRGFAATPEGIQEMNEAIITRHNSVVTSEDTVIFLGDVAMGRLADSLPLVDRLNGAEKILIPGNHDRPSHLYHHKTAEKRLEWTNEYLKYFNSIHSSHTLKVGDVEFVLHHLPYRDDSFVDHAYEGRYAEHQPKDEGKWLIHGHVHGAWRQKGRQINVGIDAWDLTPVNLDTIMEIVNA